MEIQYFTSQEAALIFGVNVSTVKRWTDEGKLKCIASAGGHRRFLLQHLADFLEHHNSRTSKINVFPIDSELDLQVAHRILRRDYGYLAEYLLPLAFDCRRDLIQHVLNGMFLAQVPLHEIFDHVITPVLHRIGTLWSEGAISVSKEHLATQALKDAIIRLQGTVQLPRERKGTVLCLNLSGELHDMALKMVDHILEMRGFTVLYTGQVTPMVDIEYIFANSRPDRLYISSTMVDDPTASQAELDRCMTLCREYGTAAFLGGPGFNVLRAPSDARLLHTFADVAES